MSKKDLFGNETYVGDTIAFTGGYRGNYLNTGEVLDFREEETTDWSSWDPVSRTYTKIKKVTNMRVKYHDGVRRWVGHDRDFVRKP